MGVSLMVVVKMVRNRSDITPHLIPPRMFFVFPFLLFSAIETYRLAVPEPDSGQR
jgi:hypothetical protein